MQMYATERPTSAMTSRTETPRNSANLEDEIRPLSAMNATSDVFVPTPIVHRIHDHKSQPKKKRLSALERDETTEILAKWKKEHEEREKARNDFFKSIATPKPSVIETQAALLGTSWPISSIWRANSG